MHFQDQEIRLDDPEHTLAGGRALAAAILAAAILTVSFERP
ncbi:hypothetical protein [Nonomuraea sp. NPDC023979]